MDIDPNIQPDANGNIPTFGFLIIQTSNPNLSFFAALTAAIFELLRPVLTPPIFMLSWILKRPVQLFKVKAGMVNYKQYQEMMKQQEAQIAAQKKVESPIVQP